MSIKDTARITELEKQMREVMQRLVQVEERASTPQAAAPVPPTSTLTLRKRPNA